MKITPKQNLSLLIKRQIRKSVGAHNNCPVIITSGDKPPKLCGQTFHYENKSGDIIWYPNAYRSAGGRPIYIASSIRVEVGANWLLNNMSLYNFRMHKLRAFK